jgi:uncharacterized protein
MPTPTIENLLVLQERDQRRHAVEIQLRAVPRDIEVIQQKITAGQGARDSARTELQQLEARKKTIETEIGSAGEQLGRYRSQQLQVRKNDEYQALGLEIAHKQAEIGGMEEDELRVMYSIDEGRRKLIEAEAELKRVTSGHEAKIQALGEREKVLQAELQAAEAAVQEARAKIEESTRRLYDRLATKPGLPVVVAVHDGKCGGCHLKISSNVESESRKADKVVTCDQCGRIVYWER